jgi:hypothetical protein
VEVIGPFAVFFVVTFVPSALILGDVVPHFVGVAGWVIAIYLIVYAVTGSPPLIGGELMKAGGDAINAAFGIGGVLGAVAGAGAAIYANNHRT